MRGILVCSWALFVCLTSLPAEVLTVAQDSIVIEGGTYDQIILDGRKYVTLREVTVRNLTGENHYAGIKMTGSKYINIDRCEVNGMASGVRGQGTCGAVKLDGASRVFIKETKMHNCNDDGIRAFNATYMTVHDCEIYRIPAGLRDRRELFLVQ